MAEAKKELLIVEAEVTPAILAVDFDSLKAELNTKLAEYDIVVTEDTVKGAKELATELNKTATAVDTRRKELVADASAPIKEFDASMKELVQLCRDGRTKITEQVATFENETKDKVRELLKEELEHQYTVWPMGEEFMTVTYEDLVILSNITAKGNLSKKATETIHQRVLACKSVENALNTRLLELENRCYRAGLKSPLGRVHVEHVLRSDEATYEHALDTLIDAELKRQEQAEQAAAQQAEKKAEVVEEVKTEVKRAAKPKSDGRTKLEVTVKFGIDVAEGTSKEAIRSKLMARLLNAGFKEDLIDSVTIEEV